MQTPDTFAQQLAAFMKATLEQESSGHYTDAGGGGYQFEPATWRSDAAAAGVSTAQYPTAQSAPPAVQDAVAAHAMTAIYNGPADQDWTKVAEVWNGGVPRPVPNPALGPGATTATYAAQVIARFEQYLGGGGPTVSEATYDDSGATVTDASLGSFLGDLLGTLTGSGPAAAGLLGSVEGPISAASGFIAFLLEFMEPANYIRLLAGIGGTAFLGAGIVLLVKEAKS
jgi:hypothetical protein